MQNKFSTELPRLEKDLFSDRLEDLFFKQSNHAENYKAEMTAHLYKDDSEGCEMIEPLNPVNSNSNNNPRQEGAIYRHQHREKINLHPTCPQEDNQYLFPDCIGNVSRVGGITSLPTNYISCMTETGNRLLREDANPNRVESIVSAEQLDMSNFARVENRSNDVNILQRNASHSRTIDPHPSVARILSGYHEGTKKQHLASNVWP